MVWEEMGLRSGVLTDYLVYMYVYMCICEYAILGLLLGL